MYLAERRTQAPSADPASAAAATSQRRRVRTALAAVPATVLALGTVSLVTDISSEMVTAVLPLYLITGLGLSPLGFGLLDGVYNGVSGLVQLLGGHLADRGRRHKAVAVVGYGLSALCKPLLLGVHTMGLIGGVLAADRTGKGLRTAPRDAMISLATQPATRGRAFGVHRAMDTAGALLGPITAFLILRAATDGYDAVFTVSACIAALGVLVLLLFVPGRAKAPDEPSADGAAIRPTWTSTLALLRRPELRRLAICAVLLGLTTVSDAFVYLLVQHRFHVSDQWFPLLPLGTAAFFLLLAVPLGAAADRIGRRTLFLAGHGTLLLAYGLLLAPLGGGAALAVLVLALHGTFYAATDGVLPAAVADAVPEELRGGGLALVGTGQSLSRFLCSLAFGAAWTGWGDRPALAAATCGLAVCAAVAVFTLKPRQDHQNRLQPRQNERAVS